MENNTSYPTIINQDVVRHYAYYQFESGDDDLKCFEGILIDMELYLEGRLIHLKRIDEFSMKGDKLYDSSPTTINETSPKEG